MKKFTSLILVILVCCTMFLTGCNLTSTDIENYNSKIVAQYGNMQINKKELNMAYNSNSSNYLNNGMSAEEAAEKVINDIIDRKLLIDYSKKTYGVISLSEGEYNSLTQQQKDGFTKGPYNYYVNNSKFYDFNTVMKSIYSYINGEVLTFENKIRAQKGLDKIDSASTETETDDKYEFDGYKKYESSLTVDKDGNIVKKVVNNVDKTLVGKFVVDVYGDADISNQALQRYLIKVKNSNLDLYANKTTYSEILEAHILDLFESYEGNRYTAIVQEEYEKALPLEEETILTYYKNKVRESNTKYNTVNGYNEYVAAMQSDHSSVYWTYTGNKGFVLTTHVLIKFDDATVNKLKNLKEKLNNGMEESAYNQQRQAILNAVGTFERDVNTGAPIYKKDSKGEFVLDSNGEKVKNFLSYSEIYNLIEKDLSQYDNIENDLLKAQLKAEAFNKYVYMYGMDGGSINATHYYACNLDTSVKDSLVENYANTARELYKENGIGSLSEPVLVESDNYSGYHIILVVNEAKNLVSYNNLNNITLEALYSERPMLGINKTTLDVVYDAITKESYSNHHAALISKLRKDFAGDKKPELFVYNYKSLIKD